MLSGLFPAAADSSETEDVLASGQGVVVTAADLRQELQILTPEQRRQVLEQRTELQNTITRIYFRRRMALLAEELGHLDDSLVQARLQRHRERLLAQLVPQRFVDALEMPDFTQEARAYYEANPEEFTPPEQVRVAQIMLQAPSEADKARRRPEAEALLERLREGAAFGELARDHSEDGSQLTDGDLGYVRRGQTVPEFESAAFALEEPGDTTGVVETRFGLHIIRLLERPATEPRPFDEVEERIAERLRQEYRQKQLSEWLQQVASPTAARVDTDKLESSWTALREAYGVEPTEATADPQAEDVETPAQ
ncbi:MAG: peptidylprolyl isomerase [Candidatus Competibacterales bacterium]|nr:peptidylprolyl isomerase [Candidatus Competibacterales bacterium]